MNVRENLVELLRNSPHLDTVKGYKGNDCTFEQGADWLIAHGVTVQECGNWKYYHKQNKAVCTSCNFERDLDANFGRAIACPNCGAKMDLKD